MNGIREIDLDRFADQADECLDFVQAGGEIIIIRDGKPVVRLVPPHSPVTPSTER